MCTRPNLIPNPLYGTAPFSFTKNVVSPTIYVPCGKCQQCRSRKQSDLLQRVQLESLRSYVYFFTLTYNEEHVPRYTLPSGITLMHPNYKHIVDMFKRIRKNKYFGDRVIKYIVCSEYTPRNARPHYHGLLFVEKLPSDIRHETDIDLEQIGKLSVLKEWRVNVATMIAKKDSRYYKKGDVIPNKRHPVYEDLCTFKQSYRHGRLRSTYDFKLVTPNKKDGTNDVSYYVSKYLFKECKQYKRIQALCYKATSTKEEARNLIHKVFKTSNVKSLNTGGVFTNKSYAAYRSACHTLVSSDLPEPLTTEEYQSRLAPSILLRHEESIYNHLLCDAKASLLSGKPICFSDIYTGKPLPINRSLLKQLPQELQDKHASLVLQLVNNKITDSQTLQKKEKRELALADKVYITDLFDEDELYLSKHSVDLSQVEDDLPDSSLDLVDWSPYDIEPDYEEFSETPPSSKDLFYDPWADFFKPIVS